jgi:hypothetical protein
VCLSSLGGPGQGISSSNSSISSPRSGAVLAPVPASMEVVPASPTASASASASTSAAKQQRHVLSTPSKTGGRGANNSTSPGTGPGAGTEAACTGLCFDAALPSALDLHGIPYATLPTIRITQRFLQYLYKAVMRTAVRATAWSGVSPVKGPKPPAMHSMSPCDVTGAAGGTGGNSSAGAVSTAGTAAAAVQVLSTSRLVLDAFVYSVHGAASNYRSTPAAKNVALDWKSLLQYFPYPLRLTIELAVQQCREDPNPAWPAYLLVLVQRNELCGMF